MAVEFEGFESEKAADCRCVANQVGEEDWLDRVRRKRRRHKRGVDMRCVICARCDMAIHTCSMLAVCVNAACGTNRAGWEQSIGNRCQVTAGHSPCIITNSKKKRFSVFQS
jgi:hypothetical protein